MKTIYLIPAIFALAFAATSCNAWLEEKPEHFLSAESEDVDADLVEAQLQGAFKALLWYKNDRPAMTGFSGTDEARGKTVEANYWAEQGALDKYNTSLNSDNWLTKWLWDSGYFSINRANNTIRAARNVTGVSDEWKLSKEGEARFVRAVAYFMTTQYFGKVCLVLEDDEVSSTPNYPRMPLEDVYKLIEEDLKFAEENLITEYRNGRPTVGAAKAMLMKLYMYAPVESGFRDLGKAKTKFEEIESLGVYKLQDEYWQLFDEDYENGTESVYEFQFAYPDEPNKFQYCSGSRILGFAEVPGSGFAIYLPSDRYLSLFEDGDGDTRFEASVRTEFYTEDGELIVDTPDPEYLAPHCKKYEDPENLAPGNSSKNIYYIRYADLILLYAECLNDAGDLAGARREVQRVRDRAGVTTPITANDKTAMLDFIYEERMRELGMEGWRRFDLIRRGVDYFVQQVDLYNPFAKGNVKPFHAVYPIPSNEISMNAGMGPEDQNEGYN